MKKETEEQRLARLEYQREWRRKKKESDPGYWQRNYTKHRDQYIQRSKENSHLQKEKYGDYYNGSEAVKESYKKCLQKRIANGKHAAWNNARRAKQNNALSAAYRKEIAEIYKNCPEGYHVDHIYPINGENFSGLHVPWNLQYLPASVNIAKSNKTPD